MIVGAALQFITNTSIQNQIEAKLKAIIQFWDEQNKLPYADRQRIDRSKLVELMRDIGGMDICLFVKGDVSHNATELYTRNSFRDISTSDEIKSTFSSVDVGIRIEITVFSDFFGLNSCIYLSSYL